MLYQTGRVALYNTSRKPKLSDSDKRKNTREEKLRGKWKNLSSHPDQQKFYKATEDLNSYCFK